jgi:AcrR family transcriptional regulator
VGQPGCPTPAVEPRTARRARLLDAAEQAVRTHGVEVSMEAISAEAGVTKPILYRHFGDRGGLLSALAHRHADRLTDELRRALADQAHPRDRIRTTIDTYLALLEREPELHRLATRVEGSPESGGALQDAMTSICAQVTATVEDELTSAGLDAVAAGTWGTAIVGMTQLVGNRWLDDPEAGRAELVDRLTDLLWRGFRGVVRDRGA